MARVLLLHGLGGTGATMRPLAAGLRALGHEVHAPTLPGHGTNPEALLSVGWADWLATALEWPADVVVGQSMGGALALAVAAAGGCRAVVAINTPPPDPDAVDGLEWRRSRGHDWVDGPPLADGEEGYAASPIHALLEMARGTLAIDLAAVVVPVLLVNSADDDVVDPAGADIIAAYVAGPATRVVLSRAGHVATLGPAREQLLDEVARFITSC